MLIDDLTQEELKQLLTYDPVTGAFTWNESPRANVKKGAIAGTINTSGHRQIRIKRRFRLAHRLAWLYVYGEWPEKEIDHKDKNKDNNAIANLREANDSQQKQNVEAYKNNKTGVLGVCYKPRDNKYIAQIQVNGKKIWVGAYGTLDEAREAYLEAKMKYHKFQPEPRV